MKTSRYARLIGAAGSLAVGAALLINHSVSAASGSTAPEAAPPPSFSCPNLQCNAAALQQRISQFPAAQPTYSGQVWATKAAVIADSLRQAQTSTGGVLSASAASTLPAAAWTETMGEFDTKQGIGSDPLIPGDRIVWIVTVHGFMAVDTRPGEAPKIQDVYTNVYDAATGDLLITAIGVDASR